MRLLNGFKLFVSGASGWNMDCVVEIWKPNCAYEGNMCRGGGEVCREFKIFIFILSTCKTSGYVSEFSNQINGYKLRTCKVLLV